MKNRGNYNYGDPNNFLISMYKIVGSLGGGDLITK